MEYPPSKAQSLKEKLVHKAIVNIDNNSIKILVWRNPLIPGVRKSLEMKRDTYDSGTKSIRINDFSSSGY